ncbi:hypothetical protein F5Y18DRAFT_426053 [Xylariaceae sp. FL1019]|nr:hypothetical protein F5Y18DRAFT_426053 [Xylariaceae sp. FL1019]
MYSPYGSYSSMSSNSQPMDITSNSYFSRDAGYHASCAFPSWPQRPSLMDETLEQRATSYLSDDDLFPCGPLEDDMNSVSSGGSTAATSPLINEEEILEMQRQKMMLQREALKHVLYEKERRRQQQKMRQRRSSSGSSKKSPKKQDQMAPITEA